jgi:antitoxin (DNA-binding transcriptional repressor) of toxin-antitoxin stability system
MRMEQITATEFRKNIAEFAREIRYAGRSFLVTANGKPMFVAVPFKTEEKTECQPSSPS